MIPYPGDNGPCRGRRAPAEADSTSSIRVREMGRPVMGNKLVLVIGGNFGGLTAALEAKAELGSDVDVTVVSAADHFLFTPSLIWLPFGKRSARDITFPLRPVFDAHGIGFVHAEATAIDPAARTVTPTSGRCYYDYLVSATGYRNSFDLGPGLGPDGYAQTIA